jgi:predicted transcriptional regulator
MLPITNLRFRRRTLGISQTRLARLSGVSRFKICMYELGDGALTEDEHGQIRAALQVEADRLRNLPDQLEIGQTQPVAPEVELG